MKTNLGRCPLTAQDSADGEVGFCVAKVLTPTYFLKKSKTQNFYKPHIYAVLDGSRVQWQRSAICPKDSFAEQSADLKSLVGV
ncbi:MAG: hypothetical protein EOM28_05825 [Clostridia bacterium]|nr:hypothetical protein [Clostridia bacterium]